MLPTTKSPPAGQKEKKMKGGESRNDDLVQKNKKERISTSKRLGGGKEGIHLENRQAAKMFRTKGRKVGASKKKIQCDKRVIKNRGGLAEFKE